MIGRRTHDFRPAITPLHAVDPAIRAATERRRWLTAVETMDRLTGSPGALDPGHTWCRVVETAEADGRPEQRLRAQES